MADACVGSIRGKVGGAAGREGWGDVFGMGEAGVCGVVWCGVRCEAGVCRALGACGLMDVWVLGAMYIAARNGAGRLID